tara:strand:- start:1209 stop:1508 length:300 start_codon:yes stop_codon:yes gene_type:complete
LDFDQKEALAYQNAPTFDDSDAESNDGQNHGHHGDSKAEKAMAKHQKQNSDEQKRRLKAEAKQRKRMEKELKRQHKEQIKATKREEQRVKKEKRHQEKL